MPVWADFVKEALEMHPEWNGDWTMPANVRKAEIDIRNGGLIRELDANADASASPTPTPKKPKDAKTAAYFDDPPSQPPADIYVTNVPAEFRRVELFIAGTVPNRPLAPVPDSTNDNGDEHPQRSPTPFDETWQESSEPQPPQSGPRTPREPSGQPNETVTVMICPLTGMRATVNCPDKMAKTYRAGTEPKEFCTFHK